MRLQKIFRQSQLRSGEIAKKRNVGYLPTPPSLGHLSVNKIEKKIVKVCNCILVLRTTNVQIMIKTLSEEHMETFQGITVDGEKATWSFGKEQTRMLLKMTLNAEDGDGLGTYYAHQ